MLNSNYHKKREAFLKIVEPRMDESLLQNLTLNTFL